MEVRKQSWEYQRDVLSGGDSSRGFLILPGHSRPVRWSFPDCLVLCDQVFLGWIWASVKSVWEHVQLLPLKDLPFLLAGGQLQGLGRLGKMCTEDGELPSSHGTRCDSLGQSLSTHPRLSLRRKTPLSGVNHCIWRAPCAAGCPSYSHTHLFSSFYTCLSYFLADLNTTYLLKWVWLTGTYRTNMMDTFPDLEEFIIFVLRKSKSCTQETHK